MTDNNTLKEIIQNLRIQRKEGEYWDFKSSYSDNLSLVHDIICLANNTNYKGDRYLIFGVADDFSITGLQAADLKKQADVIDMLSKGHFSAGNFPDITLHDIVISRKKIQIIVIKDMPLKPYFLEKDYTFQGKMVRTGVIYTRVGDKNTAKNSSASLIHIENMWRERFGLSLSPLERFIIYLKDSNKWTENYANVYYFNDFPEFTITFESDNDSGLVSDQEWTRGEIRTDNNTAYYAVLKYHQTIVGNIHIVVFDDLKKTMVAPHWTPFQNGRFYYYLADGIDYAFQCFLISLHDNKDDSQNLNSDCSYLGEFSIPVLSDQNKLEDFINKHSDYLGKPPSSDMDEQNKIFYRSLKLFREYINR